MQLYEKLLRNEDYKIESIKFISDNKWDWDHGLGHYKRVATYVKNILMQLNIDERQLELGMIAALLHDIGLSKGVRKNHATESSLMFKNYIDTDDYSSIELDIIQKAISEHSEGNNIDTPISLALVLADKLDITYHRTINSSIQDTMNKEIQKIKEVDINISENEVVVSYITDNDFNFDILKDWDKSITIPIKVAKILNKDFYCMINKNLTNIDSIVKVR